MQSQHCSLTYLYQHFHMNLFLFYQWSIDCSLKKACYLHKIFIPISGTLHIMVMTESLILFSTFYGFPRTYRLILTYQNKWISSPKLHKFARNTTRKVFKVAGGFIRYGQAYHQQVIKPIYTKHTPLPQIVIPKKKPLR